MQIIACNSHESRQRGQVALSVEMTTLLSWNIWFHLLAFFLATVTLWRLHTSAPRRTARQFWNPARLYWMTCWIWYLCGGAPASWLLSSQERTGQGSWVVPPPTTTTAFLIMFPMSLCSLLSLLPWGYRAPSSLSENLAGHFSPLESPL